MIHLPRPPKVLGLQAWATTPGQPWEFYGYLQILLNAYCFCIIIKLKNRKSNHCKSGTVCICFLSQLFSLSIIFFDIHSWFCIYFVLSTTHYMDMPSFIFHCSVRGHLGSVQSILLGIKLPWAFVFKSSCRWIFFISLGQMPRDIWKHRTVWQVYDWLFKKLSNCLPGWLLPVYTPTNNIWEFSLTHILRNIWYCHFLFFFLSCFFLR